MISPGPGEIDEAKSFNTEIVLSDKKKPLNINQLITLINNSSFVISNDTGPAHICSHLNKKGLVLFGKHTSPEKVSIEKQNFEAISVQDLNTLTVDTVIKKIKNSLN